MVLLWIGNVFSSSCRSCNVNFQFSREHWKKLLKTDLKIAWNINQIKKSVHTSSGVGRSKVFNNGRPFYLDPHNSRVIWQQCEAIWIYIIYLDGISLFIYYFEQINSYSPTYISVFRPKIPIFYSIPNSQQNKITAVITILLNSSIRLIPLNRLNKTI